MKMRISAFCLAGIIMLTGCSEQSVSQNQEMSEPSDSAMIEIDLLEAMDATNIEYLEPIDEDTVYLIAAKRDKSLPQRELVYGVCNLNDKSVSVIHRAFVPIDWAYNISVARQGQTVDMFTGQQSLVIEDGVLVSAENVSEGKYEVYVDLKNDKMVYTEGQPPSLFFSDVSGGGAVQIDTYQEIKDKEGKDAVLYPYNPKLQEGKILYGVTKDDTSLYQTVRIADTTGTILAETSQLKIRADYLDLLWNGNGFMTLESTDVYEKSLNGMATVIVQYDSLAKELTETAFEGMAISCQRKIYPGSPLYAFGYQNNDIKGVAVYNIPLNQAYFIQSVEGHVISPTTTPSGSRIIWAANGAIHFIYVSDLEQSQALPIIP